MDNREVKGIIENKLKTLICNQTICKKLEYPYCGLTKDGIVCPQDLHQDKGLTATDHKIQSDKNELKYVKTLSHCLTLLEKIEGMRGILPEERPVPKPIKIPLPPMKRSEPNFHISNSDMLGALSWNSCREETSLRIVKFGERLEGIIYKWANTYIGKDNNWRGNLTKEILREMGK